MSPILKYNKNAKYSTRDLLIWTYWQRFLSIWRICRLLKFNCLIFFKDYHILAKLGPTAVVYDECLLTNTLWMRFYNGHGKYSIFQMYRYKLNFALFFATSALGSRRLYLKQK